METKANYVAVGAFVLTCMVALAIAVLWLAGAQYANEYAVYRTYFAGPVTGLGAGTIVRYNGIDVGNVRAVNFDPNNPRQIIADLQIDPQLRLRQDATVTLEMQGLTGGIYVEITGGTIDSPFLVRGEGEDFLEIPSRQSAIQRLYEDTPELLARLTQLTEYGLDLLSDDNRQALAESLAHLRDITAAINRRSADIDLALVNFGPAVERLNQILVTADDTARSVTRLADDLDVAVTRGAVVEMEQLLVESRALVASIKRLSEDIGRQPTQLLFGDRREGYAPQ